MSERILKRKLGEIREDHTDWARVDAMTDEDLDRAIAGDADAHVPNIDWTKGRLVIPRRKQSVYLRVDPKVLDWFRQQGRGYLTRMNAVLKAYYEAHRRAQPVDNATASYWPR